MKSIRAEPHGCRDKGDERIRTAVCDGTNDPAYEAVQTLRACIDTQHYYAARERHVDGGDCPACTVHQEAHDALTVLEAALASPEART